MNAKLIVATLFFVATLSGCRASQPVDEATFARAAQALAVGDDKTQVHGALGEPNRVTDSLKGAPEADEYWLYHHPPYATVNLVVGFDASGRVKHKRVWKVWGTGTGGPITGDFVTVDDFYADQAR